VVSKNSGIAVSSVEDRGEPAVDIDPAQSLAGGEIEHVRAAAEAVEPGSRAGVGVLEASSATEAEFGGAAFYELDQPLGIDGDIIAHQNGCAAVIRLDRQQESFGRRFFRRAFGGQRLEEIKRAQRFPPYRRRAGMRNG
jgi:hypothetical protein